MSRDWVFDHDRYVIRKGYGLFNAEALARALAENPGANPMQFLVDSSLQINVMDSDYSGVEIDAINIALDKGLIPKEAAEAIHLGPSSPLYEQSIGLAIRQGGVKVNEAIRRQNQLNAPMVQGGVAGFQRIPDAFTMDMNGNMQLNEAWRIGASAQVSEQVRDSKTKAIAPFKDNALVTHISSGLTNQIEGWARPYEEGLKDIVSDYTKRRDRMVRAHRDSFTPSFREGISFHDNTQFKRFADVVGKGTESAAPGSDALVEYYASNDAFKTTGFHNHALESTYERGNRIDLPDEVPISDQQLDEERERAQLEDPSAPPLPDPSKINAIIHPEDRDSKWLNNMQSNANHYLFNTGSGKPNKQVLDYLMSPKHGMSEEEAKQLMWQARTGSGGGVAQRFKDALEQHHASKGIMPDHYEGDAVSTAPDIQTGDSRIGAEQVPDQVMATPVETPDPSVPAPQPTFVPPPPAPRTIASPPPPRGGLNLPGGLPPALQRYLMGSQTPPPTPPSGIKTDIPLSDRLPRGSF